MPNLHIKISLRSIRFKLIIKAKQTELVTHFYSSKKKTGKNAIFKKISKNALSFVYR